MKVFKEHVLNTNTFSLVQEDSYKGILHTCKVAYKFL